jgi:hypothetical protein
VEADAGARPKARPRSSHAASCPLTTRRFEPPWTTKFIIVATKSRALWRTRAGEDFGFVCCDEVPLNIAHDPRLVARRGHECASLDRSNCITTCTYWTCTILQTLDCSRRFSRACLVGSAKRILPSFSKTGAPRAARFDPAAPKTRWPTGSARS